MPSTSVTKALTKPKGARNRIQLHVNSHFETQLRKIELQEKLFNTWYGLLVELNDPETIKNVPIEKRSKVFNDLMNYAATPFRDLPISDDEGNLIDKESRIAAILMKKETN